MSIYSINREHDEEIIDIVRSVLDNGSGKAETFNENLLIKLMQLRNTPITNMWFDQAQVDQAYMKWITNEGKK